MTPLRFLLTLRAHYLVALVVFIFAFAAATAVALTLPKRYTATTALIVDVRSPDPVAALIQPASLMTQVEIIGSERVAARVVKNLGLVDNEKFKDQWLATAGKKGSLASWIADRLLAGLIVTPARDGNIISIAFGNRDPELAAAVANGFAQAYIETTIDLKVEPARQYALWFKERGNEMRENVDHAQALLSEFQKESGLLSKDEKNDIEAAQLATLLDQLVKAQAEMNDARSKERLGSAGALLSDVTDNAAIAGLRSEIAKQEARIQEVDYLGANHPQYLRMQASLRALQQRLQAETQRVTSGFAAARNFGDEKIVSLKSAIEAQKKKMIQDRIDRDRLAILQRDVDTAKNAYDSVAKRFTETELASQTTQANVSVLTSAPVPIEPSFPKPLGKSLLIAFGLSLALACGAALLLEMSDRRIRSPADLVEALPLPVLALVTRAKPPNRLLSYVRGDRTLLAHG